MPRVAVTFRCGRCRGVPWSVECWASSTRASASRRSRPRPSWRPAGRVRTLLLRGDNLLKKGKVERAAAAFTEALEIAVDPRLRDLAERRLKGLPQP